MNMTNYTSVRTKQQRSSSRQIRLLIVDDQKFIRARLQEILSREENVTVVGKASDGNKAVAMISSLRPDVVLMDIEMPKINGIKATEMVSGRFPKSRILILTAHDEDKYVRASIIAGASGYASKDISAASLVAAIETVHLGYLHFDLEILKKMQLSVAKIKQISNPALKQKFLLQQLDPDDRQIVEQPVSQSNSFVEKADEKESKTTVLVNQKDDRDELISPTLPTVKAEEFLPPIGKWLTRGSLSVLVVLASAVPTASLLKYKTKVEAQATVRPVGETRLVHSATDGKIVEILIEEGQAVEKGDLIAKVDPSRWQTKKNQLTKAIAQQKLQLTQLDTQIGIIKSQIAAQIESNNSEILAAKAQLAGDRRNYTEKNVEVDTQVTEARAQIKATEATLNAAKLKQRRYQAVANKGALSKERLAEAQLEVDRQQQEMAAVEAQLERAFAALEPDRSEVRIAQQRIYQTEKSGRASIASLNREKEALVQQRLEIERQIEQDTEELQQIDIDLSNTNITAPVDGTIAELKLRNPGQAVQPGQELAQVTPGNSALEIKASVPTGEIEKLAANQKVQMKISACPYPDYGTLNGQVSRIAKDTSKPQNSSSNSSQPQKPILAFYEVSIVPAQTEFGLGGDTCSLQLGMEGKANIITREESVMRFLLRKARLTSDL